MALATALTAVDRQEEGGVHAVVDKRGLAVQHRCGVDGPVDGVDVEPACWVLVNGIPGKKIPQH